jgi:hypothetical protein
MGEPLSEGGLRVPTGWLPGGLRVASEWLKEMYHQLVPVVTPLAGPTGSLASRARSPLSWER